MLIRKITILFCVLTHLTCSQSLFGTLTKEQRDTKRARLQQLIGELQQIMAVNPVERNATQFIRTPAENKQLAAQLQDIVTELKQAGFPIVPEQVERKIAELNELPHTASALARNYEEQTALWQKAYTEQMAKVKELEKLLRQYANTVQEVQNQLTEAHTINERLTQGTWKKAYSEEMTKNAHLTRDNQSLRQRNQQLEQVVAQLEVKNQPAPTSLQAANAMSTGDMQESVVRGSQSDTPHHERIEA